MASKRTFYAERSENSSPLQHSSSVSEIDLFKLKSIHSRQKLENFFGQPLPIDVSVSEIEAHGMKAMLQSSVPLCYFLYSLLEELCAENLFFYMEVEQFESMDFISKRYMKEIAIELYNTFIKDDSEFEVNIDTKTRKPILEEIEAGNQKCFSAAKEHIVKLMEPVFQKFKNSSVYEKMKKEIGNTTIYDKASRNSGVRILLKNLDKTLPSSNSTMSETMAQQRNDMIRAMLHAFCETRLGIDFIDRNHRVEVKNEPEPNGLSNANVHDDRANNNHH